jgi:hypothetical protein
MRPTQRLALVVALAARVAVARADSPSAIGSTVAAFTIAKSENKNQVQYAVRVDDRCVPAGGEPAFAYWLMLEQGPARTEALLPQEGEAYGIASQVVTERGRDGGEVRLFLRAVPSRAIVVDTSRAPGPGGQCRAVATTVIAGAPAHLFNVYARLKWPFGVDYLLLQGWSIDGRRLLKEKLQR